MYWYKQKNIIWKHNWSLPDNRRWIQIIHAHILPTRTEGVPAGAWAWINIVTKAHRHKRVGASSTSGQVRFVKLPCDVLWCGYYFGASRTGHAGFGWKFISCHIWQNDRNTIVYARRNYDFKIRKCFYKLAFCGPASTSTLLGTEQMQSLDVLLKPRVVGPQETQSELSEYDAELQVWQEK